MKSLLFPVRVWDAIQEGALRVVGAVGAVRFLGGAMLWRPHSVQLNQEGRDDLFLSAINPHTGERCRLPAAYLWAAIMMADLVPEVRHICLRVAFNQGSFSRTTAIDESLAVAVAEYIYHRPGSGFAEATMTQRELRQCSTVGEFMGYCGVTL